MKDSQPYHCWWCSYNPIYKFLLLLHTKRWFFLFSHMHSKAHRLCVIVSHLPQWTARFCPIDMSRSWGPWSHWHSSAQWVADRSSSSSQTCTHQVKISLTLDTDGAHHILHLLRLRLYKAPHLVLTQPQPAQDLRSRTSFLPSELKPSWIRVQH